MQRLKCTLTVFTSYRGDVDYILLQCSHAYYCQGIADVFMVLVLVLNIKRLSLASHLLQASNNTSS